MGYGGGQIYRKIKSSLYSNYIFLELESALKPFTNTKVYTQTRLDVIGNQFNILMLYAKISENKRERLLKSISEKEIEAFGIFIKHDGFIIAEVSLEADWVLHEQLVKLEGELFNDERSGWENGESPEVATYANRIAREAERLNAELNNWIRFSKKIRADSQLHKEYCEKLGYSFEGTLPPYKGCASLAKTHKCPDLPELTIKLRG